MSPATWAPRIQDKRWENQEKPQEFGDGQYVKLTGQLLGGGFNHFYVHPYLGKRSNSSNDFQMG